MSKKASPWKNSRILGEKSLTCKKIRGFSGGFLEGKSLASEKKFLAPLISKSYLPPCCDFIST